MGVPQLFQKAWEFSEVSKEQNANELVLHLNTPEGSGSLKLYELCSGIFFSFNQVYAPVWPAPSMSAGENILLLNYCISGRCEVVLDNRSYIYLADHELAITAQNVQEQYVYPTKIYEGIEFFFDLDMMNSTPNIIGELSIPISEFCLTFTQSVKNYLSEPEPHIKDVLLQLWNLRNSNQIGLLKIKALEFLFYITNQKPYFSQKPFAYYTATQVQIAKKAAAMITSDLKRHYTAKELSVQFGLGETSFKNYFKGVYGFNYSDFNRQLRMSEAARLLRETNEPIAAIAEQVGYENQSKFAAVFKKKFGYSPMEYKRQARMSAVQPSL